MVGGVHDVRDEELEHHHAHARHRAALGAELGGEHLGGWKNLF